MHFLKSHARLLCLSFFILLTAFGCGEESRTPEDEQIILSGTLDLPGGAQKTDAPVMVAVTRSLDPDRLRKHTEDELLAYVAADKQELSFRINLTDTDAEPGDRVYVFAFLDRNYDGDVPYPDAGDSIGIHSEKGRLDPTITLDPGHRSDIHIDVCREIFDYQAALSGLILGDEAGPVTLAAHAGPVMSSDFTRLDHPRIMGITSIDKPAETVDYRIDILPYGEDAPVENLQVFAILDKNQSGAVDGGDRIGFFAEGDDFSTPITLPAGEVGNIDIEFKYDVPYPCEYDVLLTGTVPAPPDGENPLYIMVFDAQNPAGVFENPYERIKYFQRIPAGVYNYNIDLSNTGLCPGDEVIVAALRDNDFTGAFPELTSGDKLGLVQNNETYRMTMELIHGINIVPPGGYEFHLNKNVYEYEAGIRYEVDLSSAEDYGPGSRIIVMAVHVDGVGISISGGTLLPEINIDIDYLLAADILRAEDIPGSSEEELPELPVLTAIYENLSVDEDAGPGEPLIECRNYGQENERTAYLFAILDKNGNNRLDENDEIGYYAGQWGFPAAIPRLTKGTNSMDGEPYPVSNFFVP